ncbi:MAG: hypothetical protein PHC49_10485 [Desulfuromonadaceae bacterium]|nr:hypothetical protein [Desulfuromonadaceae bacterium]
MTHLLKLPGCSSAFVGLGGAPRRTTDDGTLTTGTISNNIKADVLLTQITLGTAITTNFLVCNLDATRVLVVHTDQNSNGVSARIGTLGLDGQGSKNITYDSMVTAACTVFGSTTLQRLEKIGENKALFVSAYGAWIITVSGTTPSFSARTALPATAPTGVLGLSILSDGSRAIALWRTSATANVVAVLNVSGAAPTFGAAIGFTSEFSGVPRQSLCLISDSMAVVVYEESTQLHAATITISDTTATINTPLAVKSSAYTTYAQGALVAAVSSSSVVVFHRTEANVFAAYDLTISGTNLSLTATTNIPSGLFGPDQLDEHADIAVTGAGEIYMYYLNNPIIKFARFERVNESWIITGYSAIGPTTTVTTTTLVAMSISFDEFNTRFCGFATETAASSTYGYFYVLEPVIVIS